MDITIDQIRAAAESIAGAVIPTPTVPAPRLSQRLGVEIFFKLENLQATGSFKDRGAYHKLISLDPDQRQRGVIAMSAGNHAQGVAFHARRLGIPATIVMPDFAPFSKVDRTRAYGAKVLQTGDTLDASAHTAREIAAREGLAFVHPYDDPHIIAGQGTIGLEMLADQPDLDAIVVPIGGGGMISGIAIAAQTLKPDIEIYGVQAKLYPSMVQAVTGGALDLGGQTLADGIAVKNPGKLTKAIVKVRVKDIFLADEAAIESAVHCLVEEQKIVAEGAGAAGLAAITSNRERFAGRRVGCVIGGGNIDVRLLSSILTRGLVRDGRIVRLRVDIVDRPGVLGRLAQYIGETGANIIEIHHQRLFQNVPPKLAEIDAVVETRNAEHVQEIVEHLREGGLPTRVLSDRSDSSEG